jgi:Spy/CpxP family protein refolding chaperone
MAPQAFTFGYEAPWISFALAHAKEIELTTDQINGLTALRDEFQREALRLTGEIQRTEGELQLLYTRRPVDLQAVEAKTRAIAGLEADLRLGRVRTVDKGLSLLTPEQQQKLSGIAQSMGQMRGAFRRGGPWEFGR